MGLFDKFFGNKSVKDEKKNTRAITMPASKFGEAEMPSPNMWDTFEGGIPEWVLDVSDKKARKWYGNPDKDGFWAHVRRAAVGLIQVIQLQRGYNKITQKKEIDDAVMEDVDKAVKKFDCDALTKLVKENGKGILVKQLPTTKGNATKISEMNTAIALDQTYKAFSGVVAFGEMLLGDIEYKGIDLKKMIAEPCDGEMAKELVTLLDPEILKDFRTAAEDNSRWQNILQGASDTEKCIEGLLGEDRETAQNICDPSDAHANDYEKTVKNWVNRFLKNSSTVWGVMRCKDWSDPVKDFNDQMQWICGALHAHTDDKKTEFFVRPGALPSTSNVE